MRMRIAIAICFMLLSACNKQSESPTTPSGAAASPSSTACGVPLELFSQTLPPVYAKNLQTGGLQVAEITTGKNFQTLLIEFENIPSKNASLAEATTADYGMYKVCGENGKCLEVCTTDATGNSLCATEFTTTTYVEEFAIADSQLMKPEGEVFTVSATSCVIAARRLDNNGNGPSAKNPACGPWVNAQVLHAQNASPQIEGLIMQMQQEAFTRRSLSGHLATAAQAYLASSNGAAPNANLGIVAKNMYTQPQAMGDFMANGLVDTVSSSLQTASLTNTEVGALGLAGAADCPSAGAISSSPGVTSTPPAVTQVVTQVVTQGTTVVVNNTTTAVINHTETLLGDNVTVTEVEAATSSSSSAVKGAGIALVTLGSVVGVVIASKWIIGGVTAYKFSAAKTEFASTTKKLAELNKKNLNVWQTNLSNGSIVGDHILSDGTIDPKSDKTKFSAADHQQLAEERQKLKDLKTEIISNSEKLGTLEKAHPTIEVKVKSPKIQFLKNHFAGFAGIAAAIGAIVVGALLTSGTLGLAADPGDEFNATVANVYNQYSSSFLTTATLSDNLDALLATTP